MCRQGFLEWLSDNGKQKIYLIAQDFDQDVATTVWQFLNRERLGEERVIKLVNAEDRLDTTVGAYSFQDDPRFLRELAWVYRPYTEARQADRIRSMSGAEMAQLILEMGKRISTFADGKAQEAELDLSFRRLGGGEGWDLVEEIGVDARTGMFQAGVRAFISFRTRIGEDGTSVLAPSAIGKISDYIDFPVTEFYERANSKEGITKDCINRWGGSSTNGGPPREGGSRLTVKQVEEIMNSLLEEWESSELKFPIVRSD